MSKQATSSGSSRLTHLPLPIFGSVMGLTGLSIALYSVLGDWYVGRAVSLGIALCSSVIFLLLLTLFSVKIVRYPNEFRKEMQHPIRRNFIAVIPISFLLQSVAYLTTSPQSSAFLWTVGVILQTVVTIYSQLLGAGSGIFYKK